MSWGRRTPPPAPAVDTTVPGTVWATATAWLTPTVMVVRDEAWRADDPVVASHPGMFSDTPPTIRTSRGATT